MPNKFYSISLLGLDAVPIEVEADVSRSNLPAFKVVGLPDTSVQESKERVRAALENSGIPFPRARVTVNLAPAHIKKEGSLHDLSVALAIVEASGVPMLRDGRRRAFLGELALNGSVRPVSGALPAFMSALGAEFDEIYVPAGNAREVSLAIEPETKVTAYAIANLPQIMMHLRGVERLEPLAPVEWCGSPPDYPIDFAHVHGQQHAKRALEIAAAGGHNILMGGPPGSGKTMLARALPSILPVMTREEILEVTKVHSIAGVLDASSGVVPERPFRSPHHTSSGVALIGGGAWPKPGEVSLAHRGVLFLDELPEFQRSVLENLRQPLEDGFVTVSRAQCTLKFPAKFTLVAAMNPCPCGFATDSERHCTCTASGVEKYRRKISGPLLDRIDIHLEVPRVNPNDLLRSASAEPSSSIRERVTAARKKAIARLSKTRTYTNAEIGPRMMKVHCALNPETESFLCSATDRLKLSARAVNRTLKVARTIADLADERLILREHLAEALQFRESGR